MRPARRVLIPASSVAIAVCVLGARSWAQDFSGTWRTTRDDVNVTVSDWGAGCGPRPTSRQASVGREVTVRAEGEQLVLSGVRSNRTDRCWSENREVVLRGATHPSPGRWVVNCATPEGFALGEQGTYTLSASDADHLRFRDETRYEWNVQGSTCRASSVLARDYERVSAAPSTSPHPSTPPQPVADVPRVRPARDASVAPSRCDAVGPAAALAVSPQRRSVPAGGRACFRARQVDARRCELPSQETTWSVRRVSGAGEGAMEGSCFVSSSGQGEFELVAAQGALTARVTVAVVSDDEYRSLLAAHLEDPDAGAPESASGAQIGGAPVTPTQEPAGVGRALAVALAVTVLFTVAAVLAWWVRRRPRRAEAVDELPTPAPRPRRDAVPPVPFDAEPATPVMPATPQVAPAQAAVAPEHPRVEPAPPQVAHEPVPVVYAPPHAQVYPAPEPAAQPPLAPRRCPACQTWHPGELAFCPHDGTALVVGDPSAVVAARERVCPACRRRFPVPVEFCGEDGTRLVDA